MTDQNPASSSDSQPSLNLPNVFPSGPQTPKPLLVILAGIILALVTLFAGLIGIGSSHQAPIHPPVVSTTP